MFNIIINCPGPITVYPGYVRHAYIGLIPKPIFYDPGTLHVKIQLYSHEQPNVILANGTISVYTQGLNIGGVVNFEYIWELIIILIIILSFYILNIFVRRLRYAKVFKKPEKPWEIIEEKKYLEKLQKQKKLKEFNNSLKMMRDEYRSSLLWYKYHKKLISSELCKKKKQMIIESLNKIYRKVLNLFKQFKKEMTETPRINKKKINEEKYDEIKFVDKRKEKIFKKIEKQQERQKRRFEKNKLDYV